MYTNVGSTNESVSKSQRGCSAYRNVTPAPNAAGAARVASAASSAPERQSAATLSDAPTSVDGCASASAAHGPTSRGSSVLYLRARAGEIWA